MLPEYRVRGRHRRKARVKWYQCISVHELEIKVRTKRSCIYKTPNAFHGQPKIEMQIWTKEENVNAKSKPPLSWPLLTTMAIHQSNIQKCIFKRHRWSTIEWRQLGRSALATRQQAKSIGCVSWSDQQSSPPSSQTPMPRRPRTSHRWGSIEVPRSYRPRQRPMGRFVVAIDRGGLWWWRHGRGWVGQRCLGRQQRQLGLWECHRWGIDRQSTLARLQIQRPGFPVRMEDYEFKVNVSAWSTISSASILWTIEWVLTGWQKLAYN